MSWDLPHLISTLPTEGIILRFGHISAPTQSWTWCSQPIHWSSTEPACLQQSLPASCLRIANRQQIALFPQPFYFYRHHWRGERASLFISTFSPNLVFSLLKSGLRRQFPEDLRIIQDLAPTEKYKPVAALHPPSSIPQTTLDTTFLHDWPFVEVSSTSRTHNSFYRGAGSSTWARTSVSTCSLSSGSQVTNLLGTR